MGFAHGFILPIPPFFAMVGLSWMTSVLCVEIPRFIVLDRRTHMTKFVKTFITNESGATAIEYGLIAALIAVAAIAAMTTLGTKLNDTFTNVSSKL